MLPTDAASAPAPEKSNIFGAVDVPVQSSACAPEAASSNAVRAIPAAPIGRQDERRPRTDCLDSAGMQGNRVLLGLPVNICRTPLMN